MARQPSDLVTKHCTPCTSDTPALPESEVRQTIARMPGWALSTSPRPEIARTFKFANFHETMAFVNAVAWVAHREDHHPDLEVGYNRCAVRYSTHSIGGISENDLICAARVDALLT
ncbi:MAG: 4a-hydroxytetrahydrobiopterin dehydratase [Phycisphaerae bacterium]|nr:4a-hydroxytetrahydrobiopterin dehydratase [Tepidisphaeraceae bacterium]